MREIKKNRIYIGDDSQGFKNYAVADNAEEYIYETFEWANNSPNGYVAIPNFLNINTAFITPLIETLTSAKEVVFCHPMKEWNDPDFKDFFDGLEKWLGSKRGIQRLREKQWNLGPVSYDPEPYTKPKYLEPVAYRQNENGPQVWIGGCSYADGFQLTDKNKRYGQVLANLLGLKVSFLSKEGASNSWIVDQLLRSDIQQDDIVIYGMTGLSRTPIYINDDHVAVNIHSFDKKDKLFDKLLRRQNTSAHSENFEKVQNPKIKRYISEEFLLSDHFFYEAINHIEQLENFLKKIKAKFLIMYNPSIEGFYLPNTSNMLKYLSTRNSANFFIVETAKIDSALDGIHPGPLTHELYAKEILQRLISLPSG